MQAIANRTMTTMQRAFVEAEARSALSKRAEAEQKIITLNKATPIDVAALKVQQDVCEWWDKKYKSAQLKLKRGY